MYTNTEPIKYILISNQNHKYMCTCTHMVFLHVIPPLIFSLGTNVYPSNPKLGFRFEFDNTISAASTKKPYIGCNLMLSS